MDKHIKTTDFTTSGFVKKNVEYFEQKKQWNIFRF